MEMIAKLEYCIENTSKLRLIWYGLQHCRGNDNEFLNSVSLCCQTTSRKTACCFAWGQAKE